MNSNFGSNMAELKFMLNDITRNNSWHFKFRLFIKHFHSGTLSISKVWVAFYILCILIIWIVPWTGSTELRTNVFGANNERHVFFSKHRTVRTVHFVRTPVRWSLTLTRFKPYQEYQEWRLFVSTKFPRQSKTSTLWTTRKSNLGLLSTST